MEPSSTQIKINISQQNGSYSHIRLCKPLSLPSDYLSSLKSSNTSLFLPPKTILNSTSLTFCSNLTFNTSKNTQTFAQFSRNLKQYQIFSQGFHWISVSITSCYMPVTPSISHQLNYTVTFKHSILA